MRLLVVDDSRLILAMLSAMLQSAGYTDIQTAETVDQAWQYLSEAQEQPGERSFDLILMDLTMPDKDGLTAIRQITSTSQLQDIPIIAVTGRTDAEDLQAAFEAGAVDFITKPVNEIVLLTRVRSALNLKSEMDRRKQREYELVQVTRQLEAANRRLRHLSSTDSVTGISNRRDFDTVLELEWRRAQRGSDWLSLLMIDIDHFKTYNDAYGHPQGDNCLRSVAQILASAARRTGDLVARYGGEEFALILPGTEPSGALIVAERLRAEIEQQGIRHPTSSISEWVTISIGLSATIPDIEDSAEALVEAADKALYRAKQAGRNRVVPAFDTEHILLA